MKERQEQICTTPAKNFIDRLNRFVDKKMSQREVSFTYMIGLDRSTSTVCNKNAK